MCPDLIVFPCEAIQARIIAAIGLGSDKINLILAEELTPDLYYTLVWKDSGAACRCSLVPLLFVTCTNVWALTDLREVPDRQEVAASRATNQAHAMRNAWNTQ